MKPRRLTQVNTQVVVPFLVSTRNWGLYWNNYSKIEFNPCETEIALTPAGEGKTEVVSVTTGHGNAQGKRTNAVGDGIQGPRTSPRSTEANPTRISTFLSSTRTTTSVAASQGDAASRRVGMTHRAKGFSI